MARPTYQPMLATLGGLADARPGPAWAFEFKWDGIRALVHNDRNGMRILTRNGHDVRRTFPELAQMRVPLDGRDAVVDGEIVTLDPAGKPDFGLLQQRLNLVDPHVIRQRASRMPATFFAFDILRLDDKEIIDLPYAERRVALSGLELAGPHWQTPAYHVGAGQALLAVSRERGIEGIVAKRLTSRYLPGRRSAEWVKIKNTERQEFVVVGWTDGHGARRSTFGALLLAAHDADGDLVFAGACGTGFNDDTLREILGLLQPLETDRSPLLHEPAVAEAHWVHPELVAEVEFRGWTPHRHLRAPSFVTLRGDKFPDDVTLESFPPTQDVIPHA